MLKAPHRALKRIILCETTIKPPKGMEVRHFYRLQLIFDIFQLDLSNIESNNIKLYIDVKPECMYTYNICICDTLSKHRTLNPRLR